MTASKAKILLKLIGAMAFLLVACNSPAPENTKLSAGNPIITSIFTADPSAHVWPAYDRLFLYASHDIFPAQGCNLMDQYHVFSTDNMVDWIDHGEILRRNDLPVDTWGPHYDDAYFMWAPDAAYNPRASRGGPYFFYFPHSTGTDGGPNGWGENWKIGVVWSESPYKDFHSEAVMMRYKDGTVINGTGKLIDPCIFNDNDDFYLVTGGSQEFRIAKLENDMVTLAEDFHVYTQQQLPHFHEGPWMFTRINDSGAKIYYLMYPGNTGSRNGDDMLYATSNNPYGPWDYKGSILDPVGTGDTSHGSIVEFRGKWYLFYHNAALSKGIGVLRSVCVDELFFNPDGTIQKAIQTTTSVVQNGPTLNTETLDKEFGRGNYQIETKIHLLTGENHEGYVLDKAYNVKGSNVSYGGGTTMGGQSLENMHISGSYAEFAAINGGAGGRALLQLDYARGDSTAGALQVIVAGQSYFLHCPATGGWGTFGNTYCLVDLEPGAGNTIRFSGTAVNIRSISIHLVQ